MNGLRGRMRSLRSGRILGLTATAVVWVVLLLGVAIPHWQTVQHQNIEIQKLASRLADLDRWATAGLWLEHALAIRESEVAAQWSQLFPAERDREQLFLALAGAADRSGVGSFRLEEIAESDTPFIHDMDDGDDSSKDTQEWADLDGDEAGRFQVAPSWYTVRASFAGDYARTAAFLRELAGIDRAVGVHRLVIRPARTGLDVEVELRIYVNRAQVS